MKLQKRVGSEDCRNPRPWVQGMPEPTRCGGRGFRECRNPRCVGSGNSGTHALWVQGTRARARQAGRQSEVPRCLGVSLVRRRRTLDTYTSGCCVQRAKSRMRGSSGHADRLKKSATRQERNTSPVRPPFLNCGTQQQFKLAISNALVPQAVETCDLCSCAGASCFATPKARMIPRHKLTGVVSEGREESFDQSPLDFLSSSKILQILNLFHTLLQPQLCTMQPIFCGSHSYSKERLCTAQNPARLCAAQNPKTHKKGLGFFFR